MIILNGPRVGKIYNMPKSVQYIKTYDLGYDPILKYDRPYVFVHYRTKNGWELHSWGKY